MHIPKSKWLPALVRCGWTFLFFLPMLLLILVTQLLEEYFPFSHFPMYDNMGDSTYYVFVTDGEGNPLPSVPVVGERTTKIKRVFDTELRRVQKQLLQQNISKRLSELTLEERAPCALHTLEWLRDVALGSELKKPLFESYDSIRLYQAYVLMEDGKVVEPTPELVGEIPTSTTE